MPLARLATTPILRTHADLRAAARLAGAPHRVLRAIAGPWQMPTLSERLPFPPPLRARVRALGGRLIVTNPCAAARLPRAVGPLATAVLRRALRAAGEGPLPGAEQASVGRHLGDARADAERRRVDALLARADARARAVVSRGAARWSVVGLFEPTTLDVRIGESAAATVEPAPIPLVAVPCFRLAIVVGEGDAPPANGALDDAVRAAPAVSWPPGGAPLPWLVTRLLLPDALVARGMDAATLAAWGARTGRAGPTSRDSYWYADSWDRFLEPGRFVGHVTPADVARSRRGSVPHTRRAAGDDAGFDDGYDFVPVEPLTPSVERGVCVPPGYALVDCVGTLEVCVVAL